MQQTTDITHSIRTRRGPHWDLVSTGLRSFLETPVFDSGSVLDCGMLGPIMSEVQVLQHVQLHLKLLCLAGIMVQGCSRPDSSLGKARGQLATQPP